MTTLFRANYRLSSVFLAHLIVASLAAPLCAGILVQSTFDTDRQGFSPTYGADVGSALVWRSSGGNPGGYLGANDQPGVGAFTWWYLAQSDSPSSSFLGNHANAYGGTLSYDVRLSTLSGSYYQANSDYDVQLISSGTTLTYYGGFHPSTDWSSFSVPLVASAGWQKFVAFGSYVAATEADLLGVLGNVQQFEIRGNYMTGEDGSGLDNVTLSSAVPEPGTLTLWATGVGSLLFVAWRRRRRVG
jgi:hypothetical protein